MIGLVLKLFEVSSDPTEPVVDPQEVCLCIPLNDSSFPASIDILTDLICPLVISPEDVLHLRSLLVLASRKHEQDIKKGDNEECDMVVTNNLETSNDCEDIGEEIQYNEDVLALVQVETSNNHHDDDGEDDPCLEDTLALEWAPNLSPKKSDSPLSSSGREIRVALVAPRTEYACLVDQCGEKFRLPQHLKKHHRLDHIDLYCQICRRVFANLEDFSCHLCSKMHKCDACDREFNTLHELKNHQLVHSDKKAFICHFCGKSFRQGVSLRRHSVTHEKVGKFECLTCGKMFKFKHYLAQHRLLHTGVKPHNCEFCNKEFSQR